MAAWKSVRESRAASDELAGQVRQLDETLRARQAELESLSKLHQSSQSVVEQLQDSFAQREKELIERAIYEQDQADELKRKLEVKARDFHIMQTAFDELNLQFDDMKADHQRMKTTYARVHAAHEETTARLTGNLQLISERFQTAETELVTLRARESTLLKQCDDLKIEHSTRWTPRNRDWKPSYRLFVPARARLLKQCEDLKIEHSHALNAQKSRLEADLAALRARESTLLKQCEDLNAQKSRLEADSGCCFVPVETHAF